MKTQSISKDRADLTNFVRTAADLNSGRSITPCVVACADYQFVCTYGELAEFISLTGFYNIAALFCRIYNITVNFTEQIPMFKKFGGEYIVARIAGVDLPKNKRVEVGLTYIFGIGLSSSQKILKKSGVDVNTRVKDLNDEQVAKLREVIDQEYHVEGDLRREVALDIKRLQEIGCYRGVRHRRGLPVRGQKTKTNARTRKGPKRTIANKKK